MRWLFSLAAIACVCGLSLAAAAQTTETASPVAAEAPTPANENATLIAQSAALSEPDRERARTLFSTAFQLWQSGDFTAAEFAFREGLALDPANAVANFYMGDCLKRRGDRAGARMHYERAIAFGPDAPEAFRARAALSELENIAVSVEQMTAEEIRQAVTGAWSLEWSALDGVFTNAVQLSVDTANSIHGPTRMYTLRFQEGSIDGRTIHMRWRGNLGLTWAFTGTLVSPTRMEGTIRRGDHTFVWSADKR